MKKILLFVALLALVALVGCEDETCDCPAPTASVNAPTAPTGSVDSSRPGPTGNYDPGMASVCQLGCGAKGDWTDADVVPQPGAKVGDLTRCTVSGAVFRVTDESARFTVDGATYYACCDGCAEIFKKTPTRFVRAASNAPPQAN